MASHVCRVAQELANANIFDHFMASHMRLRAEASHKGCFEASEQAELVASMIMMTRWQKQILPLLSEKFKNLIIKIQNKFNSFLIYATSESLDISRIHKVDKCHLMMTSQVSCQGHQCTVISVSSSLPLGTPPVPIRALWELFDGCTVWKTRHSVDDLSILDKRDHTGWLAWTDPWYLLENNASSPQWRFFQISVKNTSTVNQYQYKYIKPIDLKLVTIWENDTARLIKKSITIEFQQMYQILWKSWT